MTKPSEVLQSIADVLLGTKDNLAAYAYFDRMLEQDEDFQMSLKICAIIKKAADLARKEGQ